MVYRIMKISLLQNFIERSKCGKCVVIISFLDRRFDDGTVDIGEHRIQHKLAEEHGFGDVHLETASTIRPRENWNIMMGIFVENDHFLKRMPKN